MKSLGDILRTQSHIHGFPVRGENGYGGEQDGSHVEFLSFRVDSRKEARNVQIPDFAKLHWATYSPRDGWRGAIGYWSNEDISEEDEKLLSDFPESDY